MEKDTNFNDKKPQFSPLYTLAIAAVILIIIGSIDYVTGTEIALSFFYIIPILIVLWYVSTSTGIIFVILSATIWFAAEYLNRPSPNMSVLIWNSFVRLCFFLIVTYMCTKLKKAYKYLENAAKTDLLTKALNTRGFFDLLETEIQRCKRLNFPLTLAYIDLDNLKQLNDSLGHMEGDKALQAIVKTIQDQIRKFDFVGRLGGDEFALCLFNTDFENTKKTLTRIQKNLTKNVTLHRWPITFSIGVIVVYDFSRTSAELVKTADNLMYAVKREGKNNIAYKTLR